MELENSQWVTIIIIIDTCKNHPWMVKVVGENLKNDTIAS